MEVRTKIYSTFFLLQSNANFVSFTGKISLCGVCGPPGSHKLDCKNTCGNYEMRKPILKDGEAAEEMCLPKLSVTLALADSDSDSDPDPDTVEPTGNATDKTTRQPRKIIDMAAYKCDGQLKSNARLNK